MIELLAAPALAAPAADAAALLELGASAPPGAVPFAEIFAAQLAEPAPEPAEDPPATEEPEIAASPIALFLALPETVQRPPSPAAGEPQNPVAIEITSRSEPAAKAQAQPPEVQPQPPEIHAQPPEVQAQAPEVQTQAPDVQTQAPADPPLALPAPAAPAAARPEAPAMHVAAPVASREWSGELGVRLVWLAREGIGEAQIVLEPQELGPVHVRISVESGSAAVAMAASLPETRHALEAALPALREMLAASGIELAEASVSAEPGAGERRPRPPEPAPRSSSGVLEAHGGEPVPARARGLVDLYA
jgi:flagellar hook-length control protein FliK